MLNSLLRLTSLSCSLCSLSTSRDYFLPVFSSKEEVRHSIECLDDVLNQFDDVGGVASSEEVFHTMPRSNLQQRHSVQAPTIQQMQAKMIAMQAQMQHHHLNKQAPPPGKYFCNVTKLHPSEFLARLCLRTYQ